MADETDHDDTGAKSNKKSKLPLLIGLVGAIVLGGGSFFAVYSGMILAPDPMIGGVQTVEEETLEPAGPLPNIAFVPVQPMVINLGQASSSRHLKFEAQLEIVPKYEEEVILLLPRVTDVINSYLRAVPVSKLEEPTALIDIRRQMLRRIQIITGEGRVRDLLIMEFVLN